MTDTYTIQATEPDFGLPRHLFIFVDGKRQPVSAELIRVHDLRPGDLIIVQKQTSDSP